MRQKVATLIVRLRIPLMILMLILAVLCGTTIRSVKVNYDLISYLDDDTAAMRGLAIMSSEFSGVSGMSVALKNSTEEDAQQTASWIATLDGVMLANHDAETGVKEHDGGTYRLIRVIANADNSDAVYDAIEAQLADTPHFEQASLCGHGCAHHHHGAGHDGKLSRWLGLDASNKPSFENPWTMGCG